jgi:hypothetical protein
MQGNVAKVLLMFRSYGQGITSLLARSVWETTRGESAAVKVEARQPLAGIPGMTFAFSGAVGMPMIGAWNAKMDPALRISSRTVRQSVRGRGATASGPSPGWCCTRGRWGCGSGWA